MDDGHERLELPIVYICSTLHLVLHKLRELRRIVPVVNYVLHQEFLLHGAELLICVLVLVEGATVHLDTIWISVKHVFFRAIELILCC